MPAAYEQQELLTLAAENAGLESNDRMNFV